MLFLKNSLFKENLFIVLFKSLISSGLFINPSSLPILRNLFSGYDEGALVIVPPEDLYKGKNVDPSQQFKIAMNHVDFLTEIDIGSNSWVVGGNLSSTGKPLMAGDPHRGLDTPSVYYQNHIS